MSAPNARIERPDPITEARLNAHNEAVLPALMAEAFEQLSPAQQQAVYRIADLFLNAKAWRRGALGHDPRVVLDFDALARCGRP